jgi:hypothetical protein
MHWFVIFTFLVVAYIAFSFWIIGRVIAWNVVMAAVAMRGADEEGKKQLHATVFDLLMRNKLPASLYPESSAAVQYALLSLAMRELQVPTIDPAIPFRHLKKPLLADGARKHIWAVCRKVEAKYGISLPELHQPNAGS